jgi:Fe-S-cluster containining protein
MAFVGDPVAGTLRFACTNCGKCCTFPGDSSLYLDPREAVDHLHHFPLRVFVEYIVLGPGPMPISTRLLAANHPETAAIGAALERWYRDTRPVVGESQTPVGTREVLVTSRLLTLPRVDSRCLHLGEDRRCTIHAVRPRACRTFPLHGDSPAIARGIASITLNHLEQFDCDFGPDAPALLENNQIQLPGFIDEAEITEGAAERRAFTDYITAEYRDLIGEALVKNLELRPATGSLQMSCVPYLRYAVRCGWMTEVDAVAALEVQIELWARRVEAAVAARDKSQRELTQQLREGIESMRGYLADARRAESNG